MALRKCSGIAEKKNLQINELKSASFFIYDLIIVNSYYGFLQVNKKLAS
jgi:hypothetical protein